MNQAAKADFPSDQEFEQLAEAFRSFTSNDLALDRLFTQWPELAFSRKRIVEEDRNWVRQGGDERCHAPQLSSAVRQAQDEEADKVEQLLQKADSAPELDAIALLLDGLTEVRRQNIQTILEAKREGLRAASRTEASVDIVLPQALETPMADETESGGVNSDREVFGSPHLISATAPAASEKPSAPEMNKKRIIAERQTKQSLVSAQTPPSSPTLPEG